MRWCSVRVLRACSACAVLLWLCGGCQNAEPSSHEAAPAQGPAESAAGMPSPKAPPSEALPRSVAGITLGTTAADAEGKIGKLVCHDNRAGFQVCNGSTPPSGEMHNLQLYVVHDRVVSVSYESAAPASMWDALNALIDRYGRPSLSGLREHDTNGRVHEIYGWKDDDSLYSVRFMWREVENADPELVGTAIALWDRKGYQEWEAEMKQRQKPTPEADEPHRPI